MLTKTSKDFGEKVDYVYMDIDQFPEIAEMLEIQRDFVDCGRCLLSLNIWTKGIVMKLLEITHGQ